MSNELGFRALYHLLKDLQSLPEEFFETSMNELARRTMVTQLKLKFWKAVIGSDIVESYTGLESKKVILYFS